MAAADGIQPLRESERKSVTAASVGIVDFDVRIASADPEDIRVGLERFDEVVRVEVERHGGTLEKLAQGAAVALFGAPRTHEDDPERGVRLGLAIVDRLQRDPAARGALRY